MNFAEAAKLIYTDEPEEKVIRTPYTRVIVSKAAFLTGVPEHHFHETSENKLDEAVYVELDQEKSARIIRNLCMVRTAFMINNDVIYDEQVQEIAIKLLKHIIDTNESITYGELSKRLSFEINPRNIERLLGVVSFACKENGLPLVSVMVVNKETQMPGDVFYKAYFPGLKTKDERWRKCFELMKQVRACKDWDMVLDAFQNWH